MHYITRHLAHWVSLIGILAVGLWGIIAFWPDKVFQSAVVVAVGVAFVVWGIVHHWLHEDLQPKIILEYLLSGIFGVVVLLSLIWR